MKTHAEYSPRESKTAAWLKPILALIAYALAIVLFATGPGTRMHSHLIAVIAGAVVVLISFKALVSWLINVLWPVVTEYMESDFKQDFRQLKPLHKILIVAGFYILLVYALIATVGALK